MKNILVLGAGQSTPYLISYLLQRAEEHDWFVTVGDLDPQLAARRIGDHARASAIHFDVNDLALRAAQFERADIVVNLLPPTFQPAIATDCVQHHAHMLSVSYTDELVRTLERDAHRAGILILTELGLDPGIDLMSASEILHDVRGRGGIVERFVSYGSGVPEPEARPNPLRYCVTWNPRNVVMAAEYGAQYLEDGDIKIVPWHHVFRHSWTVQVPGIGPMEAYPNRDSLSYQETFGLKHADTIIRSTLRYPGWSETWLQIVRLGLPNEHIRIPRLQERSFADIVRMFLPTTVPGSSLEHQVANFLHISPTGQIMENLRWLGLFAEEPCGTRGETASAALIDLLRDRLALPPGVRDVVIVLHDLVVRYPDENDRRERVRATFTHYGEPHGFTAMAKAVGMPTAIAARLILDDRLPLTGCHIPTEEPIFRPILAELQAEGLQFDVQVDAAE